MTDTLDLVGEKVEAVDDTEATAIVVGKALARKLVIWKRSRKVEIRQGNRSTLEGNLVVYTSFKGMDSFLVLSKFASVTKVLDIGNHDVIFRLSCSVENGFQWLLRTGT